MILSLSRSEGPHFSTRLVLPVIVLLFSTSAFAGDFQLGSGDTFDLGAGALDLGCGTFFLQNNAVFDAGNGQIKLSGDWNNQGIFNRGTSAVIFNDDCGAGTVSQVSGSTFFHDLAATTTAAHEMRFESGRQQSMANGLFLSGTDGNLLRIRSSQPGDPVFFMLETSGSQVIDNVDVQDNHGITSGQWLAPNTPEYFNSIDSGGNQRWFRNRQVTAIPVLSGLGRIVMVLSILLFAYRLLRSSPLGA